MNKGKSWSKPQLILLAKGTADECILATCKSSIVGSVGAHHNSCGTTSSCGTYCSGQT